MKLALESQDKAGSLTLHPILVIDETKNFVWTTRYGEHLRPDQLETPYLFNVVRMLYNHSVPGPLRLYPFAVHNLSAMSGRYRRAAIVSFLRVLATRRDLAKRMICELILMRDRIQRWNQVGLRYPFLNHVSFPNSSSDRSLYLH